MALRTSKALLVVRLAICGAALVKDLLAACSAAECQRLVTGTAKDAVLLTASVLALNGMTATTTCEALAVASALVCRHRFAYDLLPTPKTVWRTFFVAVLTSEAEGLVLEVGANNRAAARVAREALTVVPHTTCCNGRS